MNNHQVSTWITGLGLWPLIIAIVPNLLFRRYGEAAIKKRMASLYLALSIFVITSLAALIVQRNLTDRYLLIGFIIVLGVLFLFRSKTFPYRLICPSCAAKLDFRTIYFMDNNLCSNCHAEKKSKEEAVSPEESEVGRVTEKESPATDES